MWRAFFFAIGTMLIILGLECLVTEKFIIHGARIPGVVAKFLDGASKRPGAGIQNSTGSGFSPYGPSRFEENFAGQSQPSGNFYGGTPSNASGDSQFSLAGFGKQESGIGPGRQPAAGYGRQANQNSGRQQKKVLRPKDWMPWSLIAAGSLVVLYTNSTERRGHSSD